MGGYIGVNNVARKISSGYIGVDGIARKIKQIFIGDESGIARLIWKAVSTFTNWTNLLFDDNQTLDSAITSHDTPYVSTVTINKIKDNEFLCYGNISYRLANQSTSTSAYRKYLTVDDNGYLTYNSWSRAYDAYYMNGYYYFLPFSTYMNSSYPMVKNTSMDSYSSTTNTTIYTPAFSDVYTLVNYCKVDNNVFAAYCRHYSSSSYRHVLLLFNSDGLITTSASYNNTETYLNSTSSNQYSKLYYVKDRTLACVVGTDLYIIEISEDYKTRTKTTISLGSFAYNGTTYSSYDVNNFIFNNGNIVATFDVANGYAQNYNRVFIPIKVDYTNKTASIGTSKLVENCGSIGMCDNQFIENGTMVIFTEKQVDSSNYGHYCILMPYDSETNAFGDYSMIDGTALTSGGLYDMYHGFIPIKDGENLLKLFIFDTSSTTTDSTTWQFYFRTGSITMS